MKLVFVSNYLNHHQIPLCSQFLELCEEFHFVATDTKNVQGYQIISDADYVLEYNEETKPEVIKTVIDADVVIFGSCPNSLIAERMKVNKLSFLYSERFYKRGLWRVVSPKSYKFFTERIGQYRKSNMYVLCASAFFPLDLKFLRFPADKCYKWGYFPDVDEIPPESFDNKKKSGLIWVGRMIELKHPEMAINTAKYLKFRGYDFTLDMIGDGPLMPEIKRMISEYDLSDYVNLLGSCSHDEVLKHMQDSSVFLFTSSKIEGWGAVLNEAMGSGCVPVCSHLIGSVPFLVKNGYNGLIYRQGNQTELNKKTELLLIDGKAWAEYSRNAYNCIHKMWNADYAAKKFVELSKALLKDTPYDDLKDGPCSKAKVIPENWKY